jgi:hypothetical protein
MQKWYLLKLFQESQGEGIKEGSEGGWIQIWYTWYIVRSFVNVTMYPYPAQWKKKKIPSSVVMTVDPQGHDWMESLNVERAVVSVRSMALFCIVQTTVWFLLTLWRPYRKPLECNSREKIMCSWCWEQVKNIPAGQNGKKHRPTKESDQ